MVAVLHRESLLKLLLATVAVFALSGCASVMNDSTHPMKIETLTSDGKVISGAECKLGNDYGSITVKSGDTAQVRRSSKDMDLTCASNNQIDAKGRAISRANGGMFGNIILGGGIGAIIDHNKGTAYTYPTWIQLVFGQTRVFDRSDEKDGMPLTGRLPEVPTAAK
jgi:uncharacterized protein YceK